MEEWLFDLTEGQPTGTIITASSTVVVTHIGRPLAEAVVAAHNEEWRRQLQLRKEEIEALGETKYWLIYRDLGEGHTEPHSLVTGERPMIEQWVRHLCNGIKADMRIHPMTPKAISTADMEEVQRLFQEMRQHESESERYRGLANAARASLKNLGAPIG